MTNKEIIRKIQTEFRRSGMSYMELAAAAGVEYGTAYCAINMHDRSETIRLKTALKLLRGLGYEVRLVKNAEA